MQVNLSVSNKKEFERYYFEFNTQHNVIACENKTVFGLSEVLIIGLVFIFESSISGFTWDYLKEQILPYIKSMFTNKRRKDINYKDKRTKE